MVRGGLIYVYEYSALVPPYNETSHTKTAFVLQMTDMCVCKNRNAFEDYLYWDSLSELTKSFTSPKLFIIRLIFKGRPIRVRDAHLAYLTTNIDADALVRYTRVISGHISFQQ
jgi:hypothetical protein